MSSFLKKLMIMILIIGLIAPSWLTSFAALAATGSEVGGEEVVQLEQQALTPEQPMITYGPHYGDNTSEHAYSPFDEKQQDLQDYSFRTDQVLIKMKDSIESGFTAETTERFNKEGLHNPFESVGVSSLQAISKENQTGLFNVSSNTSTWHLATLQDGVEVENVLKALSENRLVDEVQPDYLRKIDFEGLPDKISDNKMNQQWYLNQLGIKQAWTELKNEGINPGGSRDIVVAVIDTGVDYNHEDLTGNMWVNPDEIPNNNIDDDNNGFIDDVHGVSTVGNKFAGESGDPMDDHGHGTHVAGIIAAQGHNQEGGVGVAYNVQVMAIKAAQSSGTLAASDVAEAINYAVENGADVINMSFGGYGRSTVEEDALQTAFGTSVLVAAAGNDGFHNEPRLPQGKPMYPGAYNWVLGVMAEMQNPAPNGDYLAGFSNWDPIQKNSFEYEVMVPGVDILSTLPNNEYASWSGTSMATPIIAGMAALLRSKFKDKNSYSSRFIMGQIASTGVEKQGKTPLGAKKPLMYTEANVYNALVNTPKPDLSLIEYYLFDKPEIAEGNDGDGVIDAGETVNLALIIRNHWGKAEDVQVKLDTLSPAGIEDKYVTFETDTVNFGAVGNFGIDDNGLIYGEDGAVIGVNVPFKMTVSKDAPNDHIIPFNVTLTAKNGFEPDNEQVFTFDDSFNLKVRRGRELPAIISEDMTLTTADYWLVPDSTLIEKDATVTVEPGTQIQFWSADPDDPYADKQIPYLQVEGDFIVNGTAKQPVELFAGALYPGHEVKIQKSGGYVELNYAKVMNPVIHADYIDHSYFSQDLFNRIYTRYRNNDGVITQSTNSMINAIKTSNSRFYKLGGRYDWEQLRVNGELEGNLFDSNNYNFNANKATDNVFLKNYKLYASQWGDRDYWVSDAQGFGVSLNKNSAFTSVFPIKFNDNGSTYFAVAPNAGTNGYDEMLKVEQYAQQFGGHIVTINDEAENEFIRSYVNTYVRNESLLNEEYPGVNTYNFTNYNAQPIIGLNDFDKEGTYSWISNEDSIYTNWASSEPNNKNYHENVDGFGNYIEAHFVGLNPYNGQWQDESHASYYIIEVPGVSNVTNISLDKTEMTLGAGGAAAKLRPILSPKKADNQSVTWKSSNPEVATVDENGLVTPLTIGATTITVTTEDGSYKATCEVNVIEIVPATGITLDDEILNIQIGSMKHLNATVLPAGATNKNVTWVSSNPEVVSVDNYGGIYAHSHGTATITATTEDGGFTDEVTVDVIVPIQNIDLDSTFLRLIQGEEPTKLSVVLEPTHADNKGILWSSSNESVVTVNSEGNVNPVGIGTALVTATTLDGKHTATTTVTVWDKEVSFATTKVSAGYYHSVALNNDGSVWAWGRNYNGQLGDGSNIDRTTPVEMKGIQGTDIIDVVASGSETYFLKSDGTVWRTSGYSNVTKVYNISDVTQLDKGESHTIALKADGTVWSWGSNYSGQLGDGTTTHRESPVQVLNLSDIVSISAGGQHNVALKSDGTVWTWGANGSGQLGDGTTQSNSTPVQVENLLKVTQISAGQNSSLALKEDGSVWEWGNSHRYGHRKSPVQVEGLDNITEISAGNYHSLALNVDGTVWSWGNNYNGELGQGDFSYQYYVKPVKNLDTIQSISAGRAYSLAIKEDGSIWAWGDNGYGQLGDFTTTKRSLPVKTLFGIIPDTEAPQIVSTTPANNQTGVAKDSIITIVFDEAIKNGENFGLISVKDNNYNNVSIKSKTISGNVLTIEILNELSNNIYYTVDVPSNAVKDLFNNNRIQSYNFQFTADIIAVNGINVNEQELNLFTKDEPTQLTANVLPSNATNKKVDWSSNDETIVTVNQEGLVTPIGVGEATITATTEDGGLTSRVSVVVNEFISATNVSLDQTTLDLLVGEDLTLNPSITPIDATNQDVNWISSNTEVATVNQYGSVNAISEGTTIISVITEDGGLKAEATVTVSVMPVSSVDLNKTNLRLGIGEQLQLNATVLPTNATNKNVTWKSSNAAIVSVTQDGGITALSNGTATITVTSEDGGFSAEVVVEVIVPIESISLDSDFLRLIQGEAPTKLNVILEPVDADELEISWNSSNEAVVTVDSDGNVTPVGIGTALVTATTEDGKHSATATVTVWNKEASFITSKVSADYFHSVALNTDGTVWAWGRNTDGQLGDGSTINRTTPVKVRGLENIEIVDISASKNNTYLLAIDGTVWKTNGYSDPSKVQNVNNVVQLAQGSNFTLALKSDGTVWAWGYNNYGQLGDGTTSENYYNYTSEPVQVLNLSGVKEISAGDYHGLALKEDGTVWAWGANSNGQLGDSSTQNSSTPIQVNDLTEIQQISSKSYSSIALKSDGTVWRWGYMSSYGTSKVATQVNDLSHIVEISNGINFALALKEDGTVWAWGTNENSQLGQGNSTNYYSVQQVKNLDGVESVDAGGNHSLAIKSDGSVWGWGYNGYGQIGDFSTDQHSMPVKTLFGIIPDTEGPQIVSTNPKSNQTGVAKNTKITIEFDEAIQRGDNFGSIAVKDSQANPISLKSKIISGNVITIEFLNELSNNTYYTVTIPSNSIKDLFNNSRTGTQSFSFTADIVSVNGINLDVQELNLFTKDIPTQLTASVLPLNASNKGVTWTSADEAVVSVDHNGLVTPIGVGETTIGATTEDGGFTAEVSVVVNEFISVTGISLDQTSVDLLVGEETALNPTIAPVDATNKVVNWTSSNPEIATVDSNGTVNALAEGTTTISAITEDGAFKVDAEVIVTMMPVSGINIDQPDLKVGVGDQQQLIATVLPSNATNKNVTWKSSNSGIVSVTENGWITSLAEGTATITATTEDGSFTATSVVQVVVPVSGINLQEDFMKLVIGDTATMNANVMPTNATNKTITWLSSNEAVLTVDENGVVTPVGEGTALVTALSEEGNFTDSVTITVWQEAVTFETKKVEAGNGYTVAINTDGTVWTWGSNNYGQLGDGSTTTRSTPVQVNNLTDVIDISAGSNHTLALKSDGTVWVWGSNSNGKLGVGQSEYSLEKSSLPIEVTTLSNIRAISAGSNHSLALDSDGNVYAWGFNYSYSDSSYGLLGTDNSTNYYVYTPSQVKNLEGVTDIKAGNSYSVALKGDGTVWSWGDNENGKLGDGTTYSRKSPVQVQGLTNVKKISAGSNHSFALQENGTAWSWGYGSYGQLGNGQYQSENDNSNFTTPVEVTVINDIVDIQAGNNSSFAIKQDGTVWAWGNGYLGNGSTNWRQLDAVQVKDLENITNISAGLNHTVAVKQDGTVWAWGNNSSSQLGDFTTENRTTPVKTQFGILPDNISPTVATTSPAGDAMDVATDTSFTITFDEAIKQSREFVYISVKDDTGKTISLGDKEILGNTLTFNTLNALSPGTTYTVTIPAGSVADVFNNDFANDYSFTFVTQSDSTSTTLSISKLNELFSQNQIATNNSDTVTLTSASGEKVTIVTEDGLTNEEIELVRSQFIESGALTTVRNNAFLNVWWDPDVEKWMRFYSGDGRDNRQYLSYNFWGITSDTILDKAIYDYSNDFNRSKVIYKPLLNTAPETAYPFVTDIYISTETEDRATRIGAETIEVNVKFNRDMDQSIQPAVSFGPDMPTTDYTVNGVNGGWITPRHWMGTTKITPITGDGYQFFRVAGAVAADDPWLVTGNDSERFRFEIITSGTESMNLQASGGEGKVTLSWTQDDFDTLAGYNMYRSESKDGTYVKVNDSIIPGEQKSYEDTNVTPGKMYFYKFTVLKTDRSESEFSNIAFGTPLDTIEPVITHDPITGANVGMPVQVFADVTDNVKVDTVTLFYRQSGTAEFTSREMTLTTNNRYSATIEGSVIKVPGLEYYIVASDGVSTIQKGTASAPLEVVITDAPKMTSISPKEGLETGGTEVIITGVNFKEGASVLFGDVVAEQVTFVDENQLKVTSPAHYPATVDITVENPDEYRDTYLRAFTYKMEGVEISVGTQQANIGHEITIPITITEVSGLRSIDLSLSYDQDLLTLTGAKSASLTQNFSLETNTASPGTVSLSMASGAAVEGSGTIANLTFTVNDSETTQSALTLTEYSLNSGAIVVKPVDGEFVLSDTFSISGVISYFKNSLAIQNTDIKLEGDKTYTASTNESGQYTISGIERGAYTLTATKSGENNGISSYDAALILKASAGTKSLTDNEAIAADVDGNGEVNAMDASYVLERAVGLTSGAFPGSGKIWTFVPSEKSYADLNQDYNSENLTAILIGDVSGNWNAESQSQVASNGPIFTLGERRVQPNNMITVPLSFNTNGSNFSSADVIITYDPKLLNVDEVTKSFVTENYSIVTNLTKPGEIRVALAGTESYSGFGPLLNVTFESLNATAKTPIVIESVQVNEINAQLLNDGHVIIAIKGDNNFDNVVDFRDVINSANNYGGNSSETDMNNDGVNNLLDLIKILKGMNP